MRDMFETDFDERLENQLTFIIEIDKVKQIFRKTKLFDGSRYSNDAEHSWSIAIMAVLLREYANFEVDIEKVVYMLLIHDIVEIDAGDISVYSPERDSIMEKEAEAAKRIFGILEDEQKDYFINLWKEFEARETTEAKFAAVFDRLEPLLQNYISGGQAWKALKVTYQMAIEKNKHIKDGSEKIWEFVKKLLDTASRKGYFFEVK